MSEGVQITLIICGTIIFIQIFGLIIIKSLWNKNNKLQISHNPSPKGEKPGFPGSRLL
ncbi:hypothetical protein CDLVIII_1326 [Clostridium sp. DL-VIII]|uniref:hypothetical protein n=1 Tax=Clostridium sp. DL-VIII TaxID=641107 RepID=UPI00023AF7BD|nr:hypothetical protein [Clostridium sp. DL-VIII]EHI98025.1 hypothetical protein CDLVIII_1326 [Clostridium sp. DL-VIII]